MGRVQDKVIIVTGAASGLGKTSATLLAAEGAKLVLADVDEPAGRALAEELPAAIFVPCDVGSERDWKEVFGAAEAQYGAVDVLVNNAGVAIMATIETTTLDQWEFINRVNSTSVFLGCKYGIENMKERGGSIVNMSSIASHVAIPLYAAYAATKGAIRSLTKVVAVHCQQQGYAIRCNSIHPGAMNTPMGAKAVADADAKDLSVVSSADMTLGEPEDIGYMVLYLASDESKFINGAEMVVDNGFTAA
jgi:3(or 17)beta-hydroxysteroid dehydrogenase